MDRYWWIDLAMGAVCLELAAANAHLGHMFVAGVTFATGVACLARVVAGAWAYDPRPVERPPPVLTAAGIDEAVNGQL